MKPRIAPDIDRLMWLVAEENNSRAIEDFGERFPDLRVELGKRLEIVRTLRCAGESGPRRSSIPEFQLRKTAPTPILPTRFAFVAVAVAAIAIGIAAVTVFNAPQRTAIHSPEPIPTEMPTTPPVVYHDQLPAPTPTPSPTFVEPSPDLPEEPAWAKPQNFEFHGTKLATAIRMVALAAKQRIAFAPGLPDIEITASYPQVTPLEALTRLGADYGFTAFGQEKDKILIVPARDEGAPDSTVPTPTDRSPISHQ